MKDGDDDGTIYDHLAGSGGEGERREGENPPTHTTAYAVNWLEIRGRQADIFLYLYSCD